MPWREIAQFVVVVGCGAVTGILVAAWHARFRAKSGQPYRWYHPITVGLLAVLIWQFIWAALQWVMGM